MINLCLSNVDVLMLEYKHFAGMSYKRFDNKLSA